MMRWSPGNSPDVEDRRGGGGGGMRFPGGRMGIGGLLLVLVLSIVFKKDFFTLLGGGGGDSSATAQGPVEGSAEEETLKAFVGAVLDSVQATWDSVLPSGTGTAYRHARLVLFRDAIESACGFAQAATGPFYCPGDNKVYVDLGFYQELRDRFGAPGDFAQAYVLAHEIGHHVQFLLGAEAEVRRLMNRSPDDANALSVQMELQADCYAGIWAHVAAQHGTLEPGDIEEGLGAAAAVGDDRIARMSGRRINPDGFTHGSAQQRAAWLNRGMSRGRVGECDTFGGR